MAGFSLSNINLAQTKYNKDIPVILKETVDFMSMVKEEKWEGDKIEGRLQMSLPSSVGNASGDGAQFPNPESPEFVTYQVGRRFFHGNIQITDAAVAAARGGANSFASSLDVLVRLAMQAAVEYHNVMFAGDGTGIVAALGSDIAGTEITLRSQYASGPRKDAAHPAGIWKNATYDILDASASYAVIDQVTIDSIEQTGLPGSEMTVNLDAALSVTAVAGDPVCWKDSFGVAFSGLRRLVDNTLGVTFQGVTMNDNPEYVSVVLSNSGTLRALSNTLLVQLMQGLQEMNRKLPQGLVFMAHSAQLSKFFDIYQSAVQVRPDDQVVGNGAVAMNTPFGVVKLKNSDYIPPTDLYALSPQELVFATQLPLGWRMNPGMMTKSQVAPVSTAQLYEVGEMYIKNRRKCGVIRDLSHSLVAV
jgi:hypothetical protein